MHSLYNIAVCDIVVINISYEAIYGNKDGSADGVKFLWSFSPALYVNGFQPIASHALLYNPAFLFLSKEGFQYFPAPSNHL